MQPVLATAEGEDRADVAGVYIVGGASSLPLVGRMLRDRFGRRAHRSPYPFAGVAIGLALSTDEPAGYALTDRLSRNFGVFREAEGGQRVSFDPLLPRDTVLPTVGTRSLCREYRSAHNIGHFRFVECSDLGSAGEPTGDMTPIGDVLFAFDAKLRAAKNLASVPVVRVDAGPQVREIYSVDPNGIIAVTIVDLDSGYERTFRIGG
jgi:molecular chaperone DnaK (HSP70)